MLFYFFNGRNALRTCRHFGISRQTFHRTHNEEFYHVQAESDQVPVLNSQLRRWEQTYNGVRPTSPRLTSPRWNSSPIGNEI